MSESYGNTAPHPADTERQLLVKILTALNNLTIGGDGTGNVVYGNWVGGAPSFTPGVATLSVDTSTNNLWSFSNGGWHLLV